MKKKILVTGGAGFIGSSVIRKIIKNTNHSVINLDKLTYASNLDSLASIDASNRYTFEKIDISDGNKIRGIFDKHQPDIVMNLAAETHVDRSIDTPIDFIQTNIFGTYVLLQEIRSYLQNLENEKKKKNFRLLHVSTDEVYGDLGVSNDLFTENTSYAPSSPYAASKAASDHLVRAWFRTYKIPILITNCSNNYGPYQFPEKFIPLIIINALEGKKLPIYGNGNQLRDWLYVDDHASALLNVSLNGKIGETYNIGGNNQMQNIEVAKKICRILDQLQPSKFNGIKRYEQLINYVEDRSGHDFKYGINPAKIIKELDWKPQETFETGIKKTVKWYIDNKLWYENIKNGNYSGERLGILKV